MRRAGLAVLAVALSACNFSADWGGTTFLCNADRDCPSGFVCDPDEMRCHEPGGGDGDGGPNDGDGGPTLDGPCGTVGLLGGSFGATVWQEHWGDLVWSHSGDEISTELTAGEAVAGAYGTSREYYLVDGDALSVSVVGPVSNVDVDVRLILEIEGTNVEVGVTDGDLSVEEYDGMDAVIRYTGPYDAADHRYWRLERDGDDIVASVSPDGDAWDQLATVALADPAPRNIARVAIFIDAQPTLASDMTVSITQIETAPSRNCLMEELVDDFDAPEPQPVWQAYGENAACISDQDTGVLRFTAAASDGECGYRSRVAFDPHGSALTFEVPVPGDGDAPTLEAAMRSGDGAVYHFVLRDVPRRLSMGVPAEDEVSVLFEDTYRWWRMRLEGDTMSFEVSSDGADWDLLAGFDGLTVARDMIVFLNAQGGTGEIAFDDVGLPPSD